MWLLKFHISVCILCWIALKAMRIIFRDKYKRIKTVGIKSSLWERFIIYLSNIECDTCIGGIVSGVCF